MYKVKNNLWQGSCLWPVYISDIFMSNSGCYNGYCYYIYLNNTSWSCKWSKVSRHIRHTHLRTTKEKRTLSTSTWSRGYSLQWPMWGGLVRKGYLFRLQGHERAGISLVKLNEMVGKSIISGVKRPKRANRCISWLWKIQRIWTGFHLSIEGIRKDTFSVENGI